MGDRPPLLVCQISDLHIGMDGDDPAGRGIVRAGMVIDQVAALDPAPDIVVLSGDLSDRGDAASYRRLSDRLASLRMPVLPMVGNHDHRATLLEHFPQTPVAAGFVQYAHRLGDRRLVLLDTLDEGRGGGAFCARRADWLDACLREAPDTPTVVALHHPPFAVGIDWMDPSADAPWIARLRAVVRHHPQIVGFMAGHLHRPIAVAWEGRPCIVASSVAPQLAFDLRPTPIDAPDGRPLVVIEPPAFVLHRWSDDALVSHFVRVEAAQPIVRLDDAMVPVLVEYLRDNRGS